MLLFLIAFVGAAVIALVLWKAMNTAQGETPAEPVRRPGHTRPRVSGPDDDPEFLRQLDERTRRREDPPA
ncbi:MAG TPA: hypothetical protein VGE11_16120 [Pseudonocardia sp.]